MANSRFWKRLLRRLQRLPQPPGELFQILIATGQLIGEGTDFPNLNCLFLVYPFAFEGKLIQYIGRIQRGQNSSGTIYDYRDIKIDYLEKFYKKRKKYYKKHFSLQDNEQQQAIQKISLFT